jgi:membrane-bound lytic murein transglycosylase F
LWPVIKNKEEHLKAGSNGEIIYAVVDEQFARINIRNYPDLDVSTGIGLETEYGLGSTQESVRLLGELNSWLIGFLQTSRYKDIYARYYIKGNRNFNVNDNYYTIDTGKISPFDESIRKYSSMIGWDWRLLTSLIYQESRFNANVTSWAGAFGLMQLMPVTAKRFGVQPDSPPVDHIRAGTEFLKWLDNHYRDIQNPEERIKFVLAAYNVGPGHVDDARNLARKNFANPDIWEYNVDIYLLSKSLPEFYNDPVVKHGYCRGEETFAYVTEVLERFKHYKNLVPENK